MVVFCLPVLHQSYLLSFSMGKTTIGLMSGFTLAPLVFKGRVNWWLVFGLGTLLTTLQLGYLGYLE